MLNYQLNILFDYKTVELPLNFFSVTPSKIVSSVISPSESSTPAFGCSEECLNGIIFEAQRRSFGQVNLAVTLSDHSL